MIKARIVAPIASRIADYLRLADWILGIRVSRPVDPGAGALPPCRMLPKNVLRPWFLERQKRMVGTGPQRSVISAASLSFPAFELQQGYHNPVWETRTILRTTTALFTASLILVTTFFGGARAATITTIKDDICVLKLDGDIGEGDFQRFLALAEKAYEGSDDRESSAPDTICLNSGGGSVHEGLKFAQYFYNQGVGTVVPAKAECYSMCALMFMMGLARGGEVNFANRRLHVTGTLGFHRPYLAIDTDELFSARDLSGAYDMALESMMKIMILTNSPIPWSGSTMMRQDLIHMMLTHVGNDFFYIDTVEKAGRFDIELFGYTKPTELTEEKAYYACENLFHWQVGLVGNETDYSKNKDTYGSEGSKLVENRSDRKVYSVISNDAGYHEASCLIGQKEGYFFGCGYNGYYDVSIGLGRCDLKDFEERSHWLSPLALFKPTTPIRQLTAAPMPAKQPKSQPQVNSMGMCAVIAPSGAIEREPCQAGFTSTTLSGKRFEGLEFIWPSGSKTVLLKNGDNFILNGEPAFAMPDTNYTFCFVNSQTKNRFCFKNPS